jgi:hypothetical protein
MHKWAFLKIEYIHRAPIIGVGGGYYFLFDTQGWGTPVAPPCLSPLLLYLLLFSPSSVGLLVLSFPLGSLEAQRAFPSLLLYIFVYSLLPLALPASLLWQRLLSFLLPFSACRPVYYSPVVSPVCLQACFAGTRTVILLYPILFVWKCARVWPRRTLR